MNSCPYQLYRRLPFWPHRIFIFSPPQQGPNYDPDKHSALAPSANTAPEITPYFIGVSAATPLKPMQWCECRSCAKLGLRALQKNLKSNFFLNLIHLLNLLSCWILMCSYAAHSGLLCTAPFPNKSPFKMMCKWIFKGINSVSWQGLLFLAWTRLQIRIYLGLWGFNKQQLKPLFSDAEYLVFVIFNIPIFYDNTVPLSSWSMRLEEKSGAFQKVNNFEWVKIIPLRDKYSEVQIQLMPYWKLGNTADTLC